MDRIIPHFWYDTAAYDAARRYTDAFSNPSVGLETDGTRILSRVSIADTPSGTADLVTIQLAGQRIMLISAGPLFHFTPAISFRVDCASQEETTHLWTQLSQDGETMMPLGEYPFSDCYGWTEDRYGLSWQIMHVADRRLARRSRRHSCSAAPCTGGPRKRCSSIPASSPNRKSDSSTVIETTKHRMCQVRSGT